jgi:hypothetical protein
MDNYVSYSDATELMTAIANKINNSGFITNTVNSLVNYYLKTETYSKTEVDALLQAITTLDIQAVSQLPTTNISTTTIYLVPKQDPQVPDIKDEYINLDGTTSGWELIGNTQIDLSNYVTTSDLTTALQSYATKAYVDGLIGDLSSATTTDKSSVVAAINELKSVTDTCIKNGETAQIGAVHLGEGKDGALVYTENGDVNFRTGSNGNYDLYTSIRKLYYSTMLRDIDNNYTFADLTAETNITWFTNWIDNVNFPVIYGSGVLIPAKDPSQKAIIYIGIGSGSNGEIYTNIYKNGAWGTWKQLSFQI